MIDNTLALSSFNSAKLASVTQAKNEKLDDERLKEQTDAFEAFMVKEVLNTALKDDESASLFPKSAGSDIYKSMQTDAYSRALSGGFGFSQMLYEFLKQRG